MIFSLSFFPTLQEDVIEPAVKGTLNVLNACLKAKVKRAVVVSSVAAVLMNPSWPKGQEKDETCWSDADYMKTVQVLIASRLKFQKSDFSIFEQN